MDNKQIQTAMQQAVSTISRLQSIISDLEPMAELGQLVMDDAGLYTMRDAADHLLPKTGLGRNGFMKWLRSLGVLSDTRSEKNVPKVQYIKQGYFEVKRGPVSGAPGRMFAQTFVTGKGMAWLVKIWEKYGE